VKNPLPFLLLGGGLTYAAGGIALAHQLPSLAVLALAAFLVSIVWMISLGVSEPMPYPSQGAIPSSPAAPQSRDDGSSIIIVETLSLSEAERTRVHNLDEPLDPAFVARIVSRPAPSPDAQA